MVLGGLAAGAYALVHRQLDADERRPAVTKFVEAWTHGKYNEMYALVDAPSQKANPKISFLADYRRANRAAGVQRVRAGGSATLRDDGTVHVPVTVETADFGSLRGTLVFKPSENAAGEGRVAWSPELRLPGLQKDEEVRKKSGEAPTRANIYDAGGRLLNSDPTGASIAGTAGDKPTGLERIYDERLGGRRTVTLRFGDRVIKKIPGKRGKSIHTTIRLGLQKQANAALGKNAGRRRGDQAE